MKECLPPLGRRSPSPRYILCNGGLSNINAELEKLAMNPWCAPQWVGETDLANELTDFRSGLDFQRQYARKPARCQRITVSGLTIFKASSAPGANRYNPANIRRSLPRKVSRCGRFTSQHVELMTKRQDLCLQRRSRPEQSDQRRPNQAATISPTKRIA